MARKKISQQEKPPREVSQQEKPPKEVSQQEKSLETMDNTSEKLASLKSLNALLVKETVERREQVDSLIKSKENLESEITRTATEYQRLEAEKKFLEDQTIATEIQQKLSLVFFSSQLNQQEERFKNRIRKVKEELTGQVEEKTKEINQVGNDFRSYREGVRKDLDLKQKEADRLRSLVADLEKSNEGSREEIGRMRMQRDGVVEEKAEMGRRFEDLKREMANVVKQRGDLEQAKIEQDLETQKLQKLVDLLNADLGRERGAFEGVLRERDLIQKKLDIQVAEAERLKSKLLELEKSYLAIQEELNQLRTEREGLMEERKERKRNLESLLRDKASIERSLVDSSKVIDDLKTEIAEIVREKEEIQQERGTQMMKITELQKQVDEFRATIYTLQREEESLQSKISELGKSNAEALEKQEQLRMEFNVLVEEKRERERNFDLLIEEKNSTAISLVETLQQLEVQTRKMQDIVQEKAEIEQVKINREVEIVELHKEVSDLRAAVSTLQESCRDQIETNKGLQSEAGHYRDALETVTLEKNDVKKEFDLKKKEEASLRSKVLELEKSMDETQQKLGQIRMERNHLFEDKKERESRIESLMNENVTLQSGLVETKEGIEELQAKMKSVAMYSERAFLMLKKTAELVCGKGEMGIDAEKIEEEEEIHPFASELEVIKRAFRNKEGKVEDMTRQLELLKTSVVEVEKKRSFWTWLSSATTIFAAASVAYAARGR